MARMALTFYCDDTRPYGYPPDAFETFLNFVSAEGIAGESSVILGPGRLYGYPDGSIRMLSRPKTDLEHAHIEQLHRAYACGIDAHMEIMTHWGLYDFDTDCLPEDAMHEGMWLRDPDIAVDTYASYFCHIAEEGEKIGVRFTGLTLPGCSCEACKHHRERIGETNFFREMNPNMWQGLLKAVQAGAFRNRVAACFIGYDESPPEPVLTAGDSAYGVYDIAPNARDRFGLWLNSVDHVDADYYITADGEGGRIVELLRTGAPYCAFYMHWQGVNPHDGVGWEAFTQVVRRVQTFLGDQVEWMRPSDLAERVHTQKFDNG